MSSGKSSTSSRRQLVQVGLHRPELGTAPEAEREVQASRMVCLQALEDGADGWRALAELGEGKRLIERERAVEVEPPARLRACLLQPAAGGAAVGEPDRRRFGDTACGSRPGGDRVLVHVVVEDDVAGLDPPDQRVAGLRLPAASRCGQCRSTPMSGRSVISSQNRCRGSSAHQALTWPASLGR